LKCSVVIEVKEILEAFALYKLGDKIVIKEFYVDWKSSETYACTSYRQPPSFYQHSYIGSQLSSLE